jgi:hypothetical protein
MAHSCDRNRRYQHGGPSAPLRHSRIDRCRVASLIPVMPSQHEHARRKEFNILPAIGVEYRPRRECRAVFEKILIDDRTGLQRVEFRECQFPEFAFA